MSSVVTLAKDEIYPCNWLHLNLVVERNLVSCLYVLILSKAIEVGDKEKKKGHCVCVCVYVCMHFFVHVHKHALLVGRLEGLRTSLDKQTLCLPHLFTSYSHNYTCSLRNHSDNRPTVPQKQKYHIVKQLIGQLLIYFTALLVQICITLCLPLLVIVRCWLGLESFSSYFCFSVMIKMGFIIAQFYSHGQTNASWVCLPGLWSLCLWYLIWMS